MKASIALSFCLFAALCVAGNAQVPEVSATVKDFQAREREIETKSWEEYYSAREALAREALALAEKDITTAQAEELLHWVVGRGGNSESAHTATQLLIRHHSTSLASVRELLSYAQHPTGCTPELFAGFGKAPSPEDQRWIVAACTAIHEKSLLLLADEIATDETAVSRWQVHLGSELLDRLRREDRKAFEQRVVSAFETLSEQYGKRNLGGITINQLSEGAIFAVRHLRLGKTATGLSGNTLSGKMVSLEDYQGKVVLIDFWANWCAPCVGAIPELRELSGELPASKFAILGVADGQDEDGLRRFIEDKGLDWDNIVDRRSVLQVRWQALSLPTYYVLDENGVVRFRGSDHSAAARVAWLLVHGTTESVDRAVEAIFRAFDTDKDQRIARSEMPEEAEAPFKLADLNQDGALSWDEVTQFVKDGNVTREVVEPPATPQEDARTEP